MKICHFSDSHLGAGENHPRRGKSGLTLRQEDIIDAFQKAVDRIIEIKPDICIHAGDLFHSVRPSNRIMAIAGELLYRLAEENGIPTIIISGNHDAPKQPYIGAPLEVYKQIDNLYIISGGKLEVLEICGVRFFALPHCLTTDIQKDELAGCMPDDRNEFNILIAHGVAAGMPEFSMADLGEQELPLDILDRFDYCALGHFHNSCRVSKRAWYAGSTERLSQAERTAAKGFVVVELDPFEVTFQEIKCREMLDIAAIDATGKRGDEIALIIQERVEKAGNTDKIIRINVTGVSEETLKTIPVETIAMLKQKSFALNVHFEREKTKEVSREFGRSSIGQLDTTFIEFLDATDLQGFDRDRLKREALKYLASEE